MAAGQGIDIGDAVLHFLGDTTDLDAAFQRIGAEAPAALAPAEAAISEMAGSWEFAGQTASTAASQMVAASEEVAVGTGTIRENMHTAAAEVGLLGEATGIHLPRHIRTFVAEIPAIGQALSAAFEVTAVLFLIDALVKGAEKLSAFISDTFIFSQAMKDADAQTVALNKSILAHQANIAKLDDEYKKLSESNRQLAQDDVAKAADALDKQGAAFRAALDNIHAYGDGIHDISKATHDAAVDTVNSNKVVTEELTKTLDNALLKQQQVELQSYVQLKAASIEADKERMDARIALRHSEGEALLAAGKQESGLEVLLQEKTDDDVYHAALTALQRLLALKKQEGDETKAEQIKINADIEKLQLEHQKKTIDEATKLTVELRSIITAVNQVQQGRTIPDLLLGYNPGGPFAQAEEAAAKLGITLSGTFRQNLDNATAAYFKLRDSGLATYDELQRALLKVAQAQLAYDKDLGDTTGVKAQEQAIDNLERSINKLEGTEKKFTDGIRRESPVLKAFQQELKITGDLGMAMGAALGEGITLAMQAYAQGAITVEQALAKMVQAEIQAIASIAEKRGAADLAKAWGDLGDMNYSGAALHFTAAAAWFALAGGLSAGSAALSGGGGGKGSGASSASSSAGTPSAAAQPTQQPTASLNVQHFGDGGLITQPTLAIVGEQPEVILPLRNDDAALSLMADKISQHLHANGSGSGATIVQNIQGVISADNLNQVLRKATQMINRSQARFTASNSMKLTKRS